MEIRYSNFTDTVRVTGDGMNLRLTVFNGMEGDFHIYIAPSVSVSGYGRTKREAMESFELCMGSFCSCMLGASPREMEAELVRLGFSKHGDMFLMSPVTGNAFLENTSVSTVEVAA